MRDFTLTPEILLNAYASGIFPMAESRDDPDLFWVDPRERGIIPIGGFHMSRSLRRQITRMTHEVRFDTAFADVVDACADRPETWINDLIFALYTDLFAAGFAHSVEVYDANGKLFGGVYGVALGRAFFGESMFSRQTGGSKIALAYLMDRLERAGYDLFDTQFLTDHLATLGGVEIPRADYKARLADALEDVADFHGVDTPTPQALVQRMTQTS